MRAPQWWSGINPRRRRLFAALAVVVLLTAGLLVTRALLTRDTDPTGRPAQDVLGTVVLVPGYGGSKDGLTTLAGRLQAAGRTTTIVTLPGDGTGDLLAQVAVLDGVVRDAVRRGAPSVDVIGYSAGGLVTRLWVATDHGEQWARRVVTLGAPLHGTRLASAGTVVDPDACPTACQQLATGSALLRSVTGRALPDGLPWVSVWTENDQTVTPPDSARLDGAINVPLQQVCPQAVVSHTQLPTDPLATGLVLSALVAGPVDAPHPGDCERLQAAGARK